MGTRNLTLVHLDGTYKVAQYGQWDGYPSGQGATILDFLKTWDRPDFTTKVRACSFLSSEELTALDEKIKKKQIPDWPKVWPHLSRDTGAKILQMIAASKNGLRLKNQLSFAGDSLFCEWAYVIDLDTDQFEVLQGFNQQPLQPGDRFYYVPGLEPCDGYHPVHTVARYSLTSLPTLEQVIKDCCPDDEDE